MEIVAVIVLYEQSLFCCSSYISLLEKHIHVFKKILIFDNSQSQKHQPEEFSSKFLYFHNPFNFGLSKCYNIAAGIALELGAEWLMLLDQDTFFSDDYLDKVILSKSMNPNVNLFAPKHIISNGRFLSPVKIVFKLFKIQTKIPNGLLSLRSYSPINSGLIIRVSSFKEAGGYNINVFLDFSDHEFISRFSISNPYFFVIDSVCIQDFSDDEFDCEKLQKRFVIFCECAKNCPKHGYYDHFVYLLIVLKRSISLCFRCKTLEFMKIIFYSYLQ